PGTRCAELAAALPHRLARGEDSSVSPRVAATIPETVSASTSTLRRPCRQAWSARLTAVSVRPGDDPVPHTVMILPCPPTGPGGDAARGGTTAAARMSSTAVASG